MFSLKSESLAFSSQESPAFNSRVKTPTRAAFLKRLKPRRRVRPRSSVPLSLAGLEPGVSLCPGNPCLLREKGVGSKFIARMLLKFMAGDGDVEELIASGPDFTPKDQSLECALKVMSDRQPLMSVAAFDETVGRATARRIRKQERRQVMWHRCRL